jgi:hypothetical protein
METYRYSVKLIVDIDAWDDSDAWEALQEAFGIGDQLGVTVIECNYKEVRKPKA